MTMDKTYTISKCSTCGTRYADSVVYNREKCPICDMKASLKNANLITLLRQALDQAKLYKKAGFAECEKEVLIQLYGLMFRGSE